ncbi:hypothetical protein QBC37DRAFT_406584 [Rhypophila decipiens]|uniref:Tat pathway signal sequence n=1 Tax=Rhypophila decipiens TaxID=261697 RepID=A0AAN6XUV6_9PEZI|nr:hypothetical protein QBC37DRAFT_406584 [Rhypophila decipiens]
MAKSFSSDEDPSSQEGLLNGQITPDARDHAQRKRWRTGLVLTIVNLIISITAVGTVSYLVKQSSQDSYTRWSGPQDEIIFSSLKLRNLLPSRQKSHYATNESSSIYIQPPSPEVDAAWDSLSLETSEMTAITHSQALALGRDPSLLAKVPAWWDLSTSNIPNPNNEPLYFAQIHVFHLIHCLDELRKQVHWDHYYAPPRNKSAEFYNHKNHCLHILLEELMCSASSVIITHNWRKTYHTPIADFDPQPRQCRDFDGLMEWGKEHAIRDYKRNWARLDVPEGATVLPAPNPRLY